jgi:DNA-binding FadR family transcriptional regulator
LPPQDVLSKEFDVSRTVMREALSMLLARDMLDVRPKVGTRVRPMRDWRMIDEDVVSWRFRAKPDPQFMRDVIEFRMLIEPRATAQAAVRATAVDIAGIREAFEAFKVLQPGDPNYDTADELLHTRIVQASGNQFFQQMAAIVRGAVRLVNPRVAEGRCARHRGEGPCARRRRDRTTRSARGRGRLARADRLQRRRDLARLLRRRAGAGVTLHGSFIGEPVRVS